MSRNVGPAFSLPLKAGLSSRTNLGNWRRVSSRQKASRSVQADLSRRRMDADVRRQMKRGRENVPGSNLFIFLRGIFTPSTAAVRAFPVHNC
jgi:hypothetical protein